MLRRELRAFLDAVRTLDRQTAVVLTLAPVLAILQFHLGDRDLGARVVSGWGLAPGWDGLAAWGWWFGMQGVLGFLVPVLVLKGGFRRTWGQMGLGLGDARFASLLALLYLPLVAIGTWVLSARPDFQANYPHYGPAATDWGLFWAYQALFLFYWMGWEYLWRGFTLFGTRHTLGLWAIFVQMIPFAVLHGQKPWPEALLSVVGGLALGALCWRARSFWIAVPIHSAQMLLLDLFCALRVRTGASGIGLAALAKAFGG